MWSHDKLDRSILRDLEGDEGEETHLSGTSAGTGIKMNENNDNGKKDILLQTLKERTSLTINNTQSAIRDCTGLKMGQPILLVTDSLSL